MLILLHIVTAMIVVHKKIEILYGVTFLICKGKQLEESLKHTVMKVIDFYYPHNKSLINRFKICIKNPRLFTSDSFIYATLSIPTINCSKSILNSTLSLYPLLTSTRFIRQFTIIFFFSKLASS